MFFSNQSTRKWLNALVVFSMLAYVMPMGTATTVKASPLNDSAPSDSWAVDLGDLDGDGDLDAFVGNQDGYYGDHRPGPSGFDEVWFNDGSANFTDSGQQLGQQATEAVKLADLDDDGDLDAFTANTSGPVIWVNDGSGFFVQGPTLGNSNAWAVDLGDLDGDSDADAFVGVMGGPHQIWLNQGSMDFSLQQDIGLGDSIRHVVLMDLDGDVDLDAFAVNHFNGGNRVYINDGTGNFVSGQMIPNQDAVDLSMGDVDGDGDVDAYVGNSQGEADDLYLNDGNGNFTLSLQVGNSSTEATGLGDFDNDGDLDIYMADGFGGPNRLWVNDGNGYFTDSGQALGFSYTFGTALGDLDADGDLDIFDANMMAETVWLNDSSGIFTFSGQYLGQQPPFSGVIQAGLKYNWVEGRQFTPNATVDVAIYDSAGGSLLYGPEPWQTDNQGRIWLNDFDHNLNIQPGLFITILDQATNTLESLLVSDLMITQVDFDLGLVYGTAPGNTHVDVWLHDDGGFAETTSNPDGSWIADFGGPFSRALWAGARIYDADRDETFAEANRPNFAISKDLHWVIARDWPLGSTISLTIEDTDGGIILQNFQMATASDWNPDYSELVWNDLGELESGWIATVSGGGFTKAHEITDLTITGVDAELDQVYGTTSYGNNLWVSIFESDGANRIIDVGGNFNWLADFRVPGGTPETQSTFDLVNGTSIGAQDRDDDGDWTEEHWRILDPTITVQSNHGWIDGYEWTIGSLITLTVDDDTDPENGFIIQESQTAIAADWDPRQGWVTFDIEGDHPDIDLLPGQYITMTDGNITRNMWIEEVYFDSIDEINNTAQGRGPADWPAGVWIRTNADGHWLDITIGSDGTWFADFGADGFDIQNVQDANIQVFDEFGNSTMAHLPPQPSLHAVPSYPEVHGHDWPEGSDITLIIDNDTDPNNGTLYERTKNADDDPWCGYPCFDLDGLFNLQVGQYVTMTDGIATRTVHVSGLTITNVDPQNETISGLADPGSRVAVNIWSQDGLARYVTTQANGTWIADFSIFGDEDFEQFTTDITYGDEGRAIQLSPDGSDNGTLEYWVIDWVAPPSIPLVFAISSPVDLSVSRATVENISALNTLNDSLFRLDQNGDLQPLGATDYSVSPDGLVYTVTLRSNAVWSDGEPVTAQNYVDGILRVLDPNVGSDYGFILFPIQHAQAFNKGEITDPALVGVKVFNSQTIEFTLGQRTSHFPQVLASPALLPVRQDVIDQYGDSWTSPAHFVSNGLYRLVEYDNGHIVVEQNPLYNGPATASFPQIAFDVISNPDQQIAAYKDGVVDVLLSTPIDTIMADPLLRNDLIVLPSPGLQYIGFNSQVFPTNDPLVRKALASAINRQFLVNDILMTPWRVDATGVIPPELPGYQGSTVGYSYDPLQAQTFLSQAGYPGGAGFPDLNLIAYPNNVAILEEVATQWETVLGITVNIDYYSYGERFDILSDCRESPTTCAYNGYLWGWAIDYPDAYNFLNDLFHPDGPYNFTQWDNVNYRNLIDLAVSELDPVQRISYLQQAQEILVEEDAAIAPLFHIDGALVVRPGIFPYYSPTYFTNLAYWSNSDPSDDGMSTAVLDSSGGTVSTEDNKVSVDVPVGALQNEVTLSVTDLGGNYQITGSQEELNVITSFSIQPHGLQFDVPATLTFAWDDGDNDGWVDGTSYMESNIFLRKDGEQITPVCGVNPNCDMNANLLSVEVASLSRFELAVAVNQPPADIVITAPADPVNINTSVTVEVAFKDPEDQDAHNVLIEWGDGTSTNTLVTGLTAVAVHHYESPGVYTIISMVTDSTGKSGQATHQFVVIYDPDGGFVTGGGWINSLEGAYTPEPDLTGRASFGFVSKYQKGANIPTGNTEFQFKVADFNFKSTSYDWLVIAGTKAQFKGTGTINGRGEFGFMLTVVDDSPDKFRIKIWDKTTGVVVYDNQLHQDDDAAPTTVIQGGSIVIHRSK